MKDYTLVTDAISRMNLIGGKEHNHRQYNSGSSYNCAPLATPENVDLGSEYAQVGINPNYFKNIILKILIIY